MWRYFHRRYGNLAHHENLERCLGDMARYRRMRHLHPDPDRIRREFLAGDPTYGRLFALFHMHYAERSGKRRWGDKSLHTEHYADRVFAEFPNARIIHTVRDPRDRYASVSRRHGRNASRVGAATGRWIMSMRAARRNVERFPDCYMIYRYEDLARDPEGTTRRICAFIGEDYSPDMLTLGGVPDHRNNGGNSSFGDLEPGVISTRGIGRFRQVLSRSELAFIELVAGGGLAAAGYERAEIHLTPRDRLRFCAWDLPLHFARMMGWMSLARLRMWRGARVPAFRLTDEERSG
jgi:hypothetical protein